MKTTKRILIVLVVLGITIWLGIKDAFTPEVRSTIQKPIYTIGDLNYDNALQEGKQVVKFGEMLWGLYPGGLAFRTPQEAKMFVEKNRQLLKQFSSGWAVYELSGDFELDVKPLAETPHYLKNSLLVVKKVAVTDYGE